MMPYQHSNPVRARRLLRVLSIVANLGHTERPRYGPFFAFALYSSLQARSASASQTPVTALDTTPCTAAAKALVLF